MFLGVFITAITAFFLAIVFVGVGLIGWTDRGETLEPMTTISLILLLIVTNFLGGYITAKFSQLKDYVHIASTAIVILILFIIFFDFDFSYFTFEEYFYTIGVPIFVFIGGWFGVRVKKSKIPNIPSSQTGTAEQ